MAFFPGTLATVACLVICSTAAAETGRGVVRGEVVDDSGGVMPGVTVVATAVDGRILATTVTDREGAYVLKALPAGPVRLTFELAGFDSAAVGLTVQPGVESRVVERLGLAPITESVVVYGKAPVNPPRSLPPLARQRPLLPPPPRPVAMPVPTHDRDSICGPAKPGATAESFGTILLRRYKADRGLYEAGDELVIDGGTLNGLEIGRNLVVRRYYHVSGLAGDSETGEHSSGLLQIVAAEERSSIAVVVYACDELMKGDFLASFTPEPIRIPEPVGTPAFGAAARILFADAGQMLGAPRRLMVIDQGSEDRIRVGQRLTLFRRREWDAAKPDVVGDAVVVAVRSNSATIRVERANDAISSGDWAAPQRQ
jgi:hypothetical protein